MPKFSFKWLSKFLIHLVLIFVAGIITTTSYLMIKLTDSRAQVGTSSFSINSYPSDTFTAGATTGGTQWNNISGKAYISENLLIGGSTYLSDITIERGSQALGADTAITLHDAFHSWYTMGTDDSVAVGEQNGLFELTYGPSLGSNGDKAFFMDNGGHVGIRGVNTTYGLHVPWRSGDTSPTSYFGSSDTLDDRPAVVGESYSGQGVRGISQLLNGVQGETTSGKGVYGYAGGSGHGVLGYSAGGGYGVVGQSAAADGVYGMTTGSTANNPTNGVRGETTWGNGVFGYSVNGDGMQGLSTGSTGVHGKSGSGVGVYAESTSNYGAIAYSTAFPNTFLAQTDSPQAGWVQQIARTTTQGFSGGGMLLLTNGGPVDDAGGFFIYAQNSGQFKWGVRSNGALAAKSSTFEGADYAEYFETTDTTIGKTEVVCIDKNLNNHVVRCTNQNSSIIGVVSTNPGIISLAKDISQADKQSSDPHFKIVGLMGQIPTKVSNENGLIQPGDYLTLSSTPGVAMRATRSGEVIGKALEGFVSDQIGTINVLVNPTWYGGQDFTQTIATQQKTIDLLTKEIADIKEKIK